MTASRSRATIRKISLVLTTFGLMTAAAVGVLGYVTKGPIWTRSEVLYYVNPANLDVSASAANSAVQAGASAWSRDSNAAFAFAYAGTTSASAAAYDQTNNVFFRNEANGSTIAVCYSWSSGGQLLDADIVFFDGGFSFYTGTSACSGGEYIEDVAAHEFGHALGLAHTDAPNATMYPSIPYCSQDRRSLDPDDIAGVESLYPSAGSPPSAPTNAAASTSSVSDPASQIRVTWADNSSNEDYFYVERSPDRVSWMQFRVSANATSYTDSGLDGDTTYSYRVRANNSAGNSAYSNIASATTSTTTLAAPTTPTAATNPSPGDSATGVNENSDLAWGGSAQTYDVYFWPSAQAKPSAPYRSGLTSTFLALPKLSYSTKYSWQVVARNGSLFTTGNTWTFTTRARGKK